MEKHLTKSKTLVILDNGHGSDTAGKRSPVWSNGKQLFEWSFNRVLVKYIKDYLKVLDIAYVVLVTENNDISLSERVKRADEIYDAHKKDYELVYLVSIHGNAAENPAAHGIEVFTTIGETLSDPIATVFYNRLKELGWRMRYDISDGDVDKEANFAILKCKCPAILTENGFYTNEEECKKMMDFTWHLEIAKAHYKSMFEIEKKYLRGGKL